MSESFERPNWRKLLRPGSRLLLGPGAACPLALVEDMLGQADLFNDLELVQGWTLGPAPWTDGRFGPNLRVNAFFLDPHLSDLVNAGQDDYTPVNSSEISGLFDEGILPVHGVLLMVSPPDALGYCSLGTSVDWLPAAIKSARWVAAQINPAVPRTTAFIHRSAIHCAIEAEAGLPVYTPPPPKPEETLLGEHCAQLIDDGDTLQIGVRSTGNAVARALHGHRHLGIHTEIFGDGLRTLMEKGVIDNSRKTLLPGRAVATTALGSADLYRFLHANPHIDLRPGEMVANPLFIARNARMVSINSALRVDLSGQVALDSISGFFRAGIGSQVDFVRGASMSAGGRPIIALTSTGVDANGQRYSRIVAEMPPGAGVGLNRADVHYVVTEYGVATLRGRTVQERVLELIQVAHPDFREDLLKRARAQHLVPAFVQIPPPPKEAATLLRPRKVRLRDGQLYHLRPLHPADDRRLQAFFYSHTEETVNRRYGFTVTRMSRERACELVGVDQNRDLALAILEMRGTRQIIHAVGRYYLDTDGTSAEMAFVVSEEKRRVGMARQLLESMLGIARSRGLRSLWASVDRDNLPMLKLFRRFDAREQPGEEASSVRIEIELPPEP